MHPRWTCRALRDHQKRLGDKLAEQHYARLNLHAGDCLHCGHCERRCPFHVKQMERMDEIAAHFGF